MWFYPVVGLFKLFGVSFVLLRGYCFFLSTITAVLGFLTVERITRRPWLAFLVGLLLVLVPGMTFKNYNPLVAVANCFCLAHFALAGFPLSRRPESGSPEGRFRFSWGWLVSGAVVLGLTLLIRIDIGMFFTILWLGAFALLAFRRENKPAVQLVCAPLVLIGTVAAVHFPVWLDASHRGFAPQFTAQYFSWPKSIYLSITDRFSAKATPSLPKVSTPPANTALNAESRQPVPATARQAPSWNKGLTASWAKAKTADERELFLLLYFPFVMLVPLSIWAVIRFFRSGADSEKAHRSLAALLILGGAFTVLPQYLFFRPDAPHLSEFSPSYWVAVVSALFLLGVFQGSRLDFRLTPAYLLVLFLLAQVVVFLHCMLPKRWVGTIAARLEFETGGKHGWLTTHRTQLFHGANGTNIYVTKREYDDLTALVKVIQQHSAPNEYLVAYPYHPAVNIIADRPTYEKNVYVDNATHSKNWEAEAIARIEQFKPAVIIISPWETNDTPESRFSVWAARTEAWVQAHYDYQGVFMKNEQFDVYTRKNAAPAPATPPASKPAPTAAAAAQ